MRCFIWVIISIELAIVTSKVFSLMMRPVPVSVNNENEFTERCEDGIIVVAFKNENATVKTRSYCNDVNFKKGLIIEGNHGYLLIDSSKDELDVQYKSYE